MKPIVPHKASSFLSGVSLLTLSALTVKVIAADGSTNKTYTVTVTKS